jgi:site-specific recombinase XerD
MGTQRTRSTAQQQVIDDPKTATTAQELVPSSDRTRQRTVETMMRAWLHEKVNRSGSAETERAYCRVLWGFRAVLRAEGLDLDSDVDGVRVRAQLWLTMSQRTDRGEALSASTHNLRLAILSSFYTYARTWRGSPFTDNPVEQIARRKVQTYASATPLSREHVRDRLAAIDRTTPAGLRDYALLTLALQTGRRVSELAGLALGDLEPGGSESGELLVHFRHCKGGKQIRDLVPSRVGRALRAWLETAYGGQERPENAADAPVFASLATNGTRGHQLTPQAVALICERRMGISKVHTLRHTYARTMQHLGAPVSEIQARLGHASLDTTTCYLRELESAENSRAAELEAWMGVDE